MGRDLKVLYFKNPVYQKKIHNVPNDHKDYDRDYSYEWYYCDDSGYAHCLKYDDYRGVPSRNPDLGSHDNFEGTREDLHYVIESMLTDEEDFDHRNYEAIGNLSKLLAYCPDDYDYIVIECD